MRLTYVLALLCLTTVKYSNKEAVIKATATANKLAESRNKRISRKTQITRNKKISRNKLISSTKRTGIFFSLLNLPP